MDDAVINALDVVAADEQFPNGQVSADLLRSAAHVLARAVNDYQRRLDQVEILSKAVDELEKMT
jgi:hypothetical protein